PPDLPYRQSLRQMPALESAELPAAHKLFAVCCGGLAVCLVVSVGARPGPPQAGRPRRRPPLPLLLLRPPPPGLLLLVHSPGVRFSHPPSFGQIAALPSGHRRCLKLCSLSPRGCNSCRKSLQPVPQVCSPHARQSLPCWNR